MARIERRSMLLRLDAATFDALGAASDAAGLSREGFVRRLIENQLGNPPRGLGRIRAHGIHSPRYARDSQDWRVTRGRTRRAKRGRRP